MIFSTDFILAIIGSRGTGKSRLAQRIAYETGYPFVVYDTDDSREITLWNAYRIATSWLPSGLRDVVPIIEGYWKPLIANAKALPDCLPDPDLVFSPLVPVRERIEPRSHTVYVISKNVSEVMKDPFLRTYATNRRDHHLTLILQLEHVFDLNPFWRNQMDWIAVPPEYNSNLKNKLRQLFSLDWKAWNTLQRGQFLVKEQRGKRKTFVVST